MTHPKESAGGYDATAADTKIASETIALTARVKQVAISPCVDAGGDVPGVRMKQPAEHEKQFTTLQARFALVGHALHRTQPANGPVSYYATRWGLVRYLHSLEEAHQFLSQIGGHHG